MKPPIPRPLLDLAHRLLNRRATPAPGKARPIGTAQITITPDLTHPALRHLHTLHRPHTEHGDERAYTICFECGLLWPCPTRQTLDTAATLADCPHCDPDHRTPWTGSWGAFIPTGRDRDDQPTTIHLMRPDGSHVAERDATWVRDVLRAAAEEHHRPLEHFPTDEANDRVRADASRATGMFMALDLHQALNLPCNLSADHQGHEDHSTWWADLLGRVRAQEGTAGPDNTTAPSRSSDLYARAFHALTGAIADHGRFLPLDTREHIIRQVLHELAEDLLDDDQVSDPGRTTLQVGASTYTRCLMCGEDDARFTLNTYLLDEQGISHLVGRTDVCTQCLHSPLKETG